MICATLANEPLHVSISQLYPEGDFGDPLYDLTLLCWYEAYSNRGRKHDPLNYAEAEALLRCGWSPT